MWGQPGGIELPCKYCLSQEIQAQYQECNSTKHKKPTNFQFISFHTIFFVWHPVVVTKPLLLYVHYLGLLFTYVE